MKHLKLSFGDIAQQGILYYDKEVEEACFNICDTLKIDNMPAYDSIHYYELEAKQFTKKTIREENRLTTEDKIFDKSLIQKISI